IGCTVDFRCRLVHLEIILLKKPSRTALCNKAHPSYADCGKVMGIDYLKDKRTKTTVAQNIIIDDNSLSIKSNIQGEYKVGSTTFDVTLTCLSKGVIENDLAEKIKQNIN
ncbi:hypothetical protein ACG93L_13825, partial [Acinetobacter junii]